AECGDGGVDQLHSEAGGADDDPMPLARQRPGAGDVSVQARREDEEQGPHLVTFEMGALFLVFSPCLYCNVSDSWTLPSKWRRIIISFAGIYVELVIAALATWIWWNAPDGSVTANVSLCVMVLCSVSTFVFNANPLMRFDGYYIMADWLEIPNLRDRSNRLLKNLTCEHALGMEVQP